MNKNFLIYHNPKCSKSRATLNLLIQNGINPSIKEYLNEALSKEEISSLLKKLKVSAKDIIRSKEEVFQELGLELSDDQALIEAIVEHPILLERPIVVHQDKAVIGRPPENVLTLI